MMLSDYERRILNQIEVELRRPRRRSSAVLRAARLPIAFMLLCLAIGLSEAALLPSRVGPPLAALLGTVVGWLLVSAMRQHVMGPRTRRRLRDRSKPH
jgi:hypothetical protein